MIARSAVEIEVDRKMRVKRIVEIEVGMTVVTIITMMEMTITMMTIEPRMTDTIY